MSDPMIFVGREKERENIHRLIAERDRAIICVNGPSDRKVHISSEIAPGTQAVAIALLRTP